MARNDKNPGVSFGEKLAFSSSKVDYAVSDDKKAFEIRFPTALAVGVGTPSFEGVKTGTPVSTTIYSAVVPVTGKSLKTTVIANGFAAIEAGTHTVLVLTVNDQHSVTHFGKKKNDEAITASLKFQGKAVRDLRLTLALIAEQASTSPDASALIAINDISTDAAFKKPKPKPKPKRKK
jgi:hypothetical protein